MELKDSKLIYAYEVIKKKVLSSEEYGIFIDKLISNPNFISRVGNKFDHDFSSDLADSFKDLDFVYELSCVLNMEDDFSNMIASATRDNDAIKGIVMTKLIEYYYGNTNKEDLDAYDMLLSILHAIFSTDTLISTVTSDNALYDEFKALTNSGDLDEYNHFIDEFNVVHDLTKDEKSHDRIIEIITENNDELSKYVSLGLKKKSAEEIDDILSKIPKELIFYDIQKSM